MKQPRGAARALHLIPLLLFTICILGGNAPPGTTLPPKGGSPPLDQLTASCPAFDPARLPADLAPSLTAEAGAIGGAFAVSSLGSATYDMPIAVPPGVAGMEPSLSIGYHSSAGEGFLGAGFALGGLSAITRCQRELADDGEVRPVTYDEGDPLCLDGARLVQVGASFDFDGSARREYRTVPDSFAKVVAHYPAGVPHARGPERFEVFRTFLNTGDGFVSGGGVASLSGPMLPEHLPRAVRG